MLASHLRPSEAQRAQQAPAPEMKGGKPQGLDQLRVMPQRPDAGASLRPPGPALADAHTPKVLQKPIDSGRPELPPAMGRGQRGKWRTQPYEAESSVMPQPQRGRGQRESKSPQKRRRTIPLHEAAFEAESSTKYNKRKSIQAASGGSGAEDAEPTSKAKKRKKRKNEVPDAIPNLGHLQNPGRAELQQQFQDLEEAGQALGEAGGSYPPEGMGDILVGVLPTETNIRPSTTQKAAAETVWKYWLGMEHGRADLTT